jgi:hypothetical protein
MTDPTSRQRGRPKKDKTVTLKKKIFWSKVLTVSRNVTLTLTFSTVTCVPFKGTQACVSGLKSPSGLIFEIHNHIDIWFVEPGEPRQSCSRGLCMTLSVYRTVMFRMVGRKICE